MEQKSASTEGLYILDHLGYRTVERTLTLAPNWDSILKVEEFSDEHWSQWGCLDQCLGKEYMKDHSQLHATLLLGISLWWDNTRFTGRCEKIPPTKPVTKLSQWGCWYECGSIKSTHHLYTAFREKVLSSHSVGTLVSNWAGCVGKMAVVVSVTWCEVHKQKQNSVKHFCVWTKLFAYRRVCEPRYYYIIFASIKIKIQKQKTKRMSEIVDAQPMVVTLTGHLFLHN